MTNSSPLGKDVILDRLAPDVMAAFIVPPAVGAPQDGMVLYWDNASSSWKVKAVSASLSEVQFLASQAALGNLVTVAAFVNAPANNTVIVSYTPAAGKTFTVYAARLSVNGATSINGQISVRNNGTAKEHWGGNPAATAVGECSLYADYKIKGDQLAGDGAKTYDIFNVTAFTGANISPFLEGYIA